MFINNNKQIKNIKYNIQQNFGPGTLGDIESHPSLKHQITPQCWNGVNVRCLLT